MGLVRRIRLLDTGQRQAVGLSCLWDRSKLPSFGVHGGLAGAPQRVRIIRAGGGEDLVPIELGTKTTLMELFHRDVVSMETGGAGGYGDPLDREPAAVSDDVARGFVTVEAAEREYGVVIDARSGQVSAAATKARRDVLGAARTTAVVAACDILFLGERRTTRLHPLFLDALGCDEGFVEVVGTWPAPLRVWAIRDESIDTGSIALDQAARRMTGLKIADRALVRPLPAHSAIPCA
jgi:N-methylhydantoinase B